MRVLWFANTPCNADEYFNSELKGTGGWLKALDVELQEHVELNIAFYSKKRIEPFTYKKTKYYPIYIEQNLLIKILKRLTNHVVFKEHLNIYKKIVSQIKPDIIHIHGTENPFGYIANETNIPVVISIQGNITVLYHKFLSGIEKKYLSVTNFSLSNPLGLFKNYRNSYRAFYKMMLREREILLNAKYIIGRTNWDYYITRVLAPNSKYYHVDEILRNGFYANAGKWKPKNRQKKIILTVSGISFYKGLETVCEAMHELQSIGIDIEWRIAGISNNDLIVKIVRKKLGKKYPQRGLVYLGNLNENKIIEQMLDADIYVMPSHIENSPNNLCEAQMIGIPCIATYVGGSESLLTNKKDGILLQDGDPCALAGTIYHLLKNESKIIMYSINSLKKSTQRHNKKRILKTLLEIYNHIIKKQNEHYC